MLTKRELEILNYLKQGLKQKDIVGKLEISQPTISRFQNNIRRKYKEALETIGIIKGTGIKIEI